MKLVLDMYRKTADRSAPASAMALSGAAQMSLLPRTKNAVSALIDLVPLNASLRTFTKDVVGPAARELGQAWVDDRLTFADVTLGLARLQTAVQRFPVSDDWQEVSSKPAGSVFVSALVDTQHTLGSAIACRAFSDAGWDVTQLDKPDLTDAAISYLRANPVDIVALAVGTTERAQEADLAIRRIRAAAPDAVIYLSGPAVSNEPELFKGLGADIVGADVFEVAASKTLFRRASAAA